MFYVGESDSQTLICLGEWRNFLVMYLFLRQDKNKWNHSHYLWTEEAVFTNAYVQGNTQWHCWAAGQASSMTAFLDVLIGVLSLSSQAPLVWQVTVCLQTLSNLLWKQSWRQCEQIQSCLNSPGVDYKVEEHLGFVLVRPLANKPYWHQGRGLFSGYSCSFYGIDMQNGPGAHDR